MEIEITDEEWFAAIAGTGTIDGRISVRLPALPPAGVQKRYNGQHGMATLRHAFAIYRCFRSRLAGSPADPVVMDFGAGWGRVARFFLRDTLPANLWAVDPLQESIDWMGKTGLPCRKVKSEPPPPIPGPRPAPST